MERLIGYIAADTRGMPPSDIVSRLSAYGYDAVDWTMEQFDPIEHPASQLRGLVSLAADHGLSVRQLMVHQDYVVDEPGIWEERVRRTELALEAAAEAGIPTIGVLTGPNRWETGHAEIGRDVSEARAWSLALDALERVLRRAEDLGSVLVCLEPCWGTLVRDRYRAEYALARLPSTHLGLNIDPSHFVMSGDDVTDLVRASSERIGHVHLKDAFGVEGDPGKDFIFLLPGEGSVCWTEFFAALDQVGYSGAMSVEFEAFTLLDGPLRGDVGAGMRLARELVQGLTSNSAGV
jgi:sugar phosphate isomerase/epimerase